MTTSEMMQWLRSFRFKPFCPICRQLKYDDRGNYRCRSFTHFGVMYDYELEQVVVRPVTDADRAHMRRLFGS